MPVSAKLAQYIARDFIRTHDLVPTAEADLILLAPKLSENDEANKVLLDDWLAERRASDSNYLRKSPEVKLSELIDPAMEAKGFGPDATPQGRAALYRHYGEELFNERMKAWGASPGIIRSGTTPDGGKADASTVEKAKQIVADQYANCPLNPLKRYLDQASREREIGKYIVKFGSKQASKAAAHFGVDLAARELRKRA
jgi:hypothetical protein